ncbi:hypothetical protein AOLI_G00167930 [Acnodon oligacanthus]
MTCFMHDLIHQDLPPKTLIAYEAKLVAFTCFDPQQKTLQSVVFHSLDVVHIWCSSEKSGAARELLLSSQHSDDMNSELRALMWRRQLTLMMKPERWKQGTE